MDKFLELPEQDDNAIKGDVLEAEAFLYKYPDIEAIDVLIPDLNGILRGKRVPRERLNKVYQEGVALPGSIFAAMITGDTVEETGLGFTEGDADRVCWPIAESLKLSPWQPRPMAQVLMAMFSADEQPFFADPRHVLMRVQQRFVELKLTPVVAFELEFYLLDAALDASGVPQPPLAPRRFSREHQNQIYGIRELEAFDALLDDIIKTAARQDIPVDTIVAEYAPGQYEVNLKHVSNPFNACDHAVLLKRLIKALAEQHGYVATFMARPYAEWMGNGMHVHISLLDQQGSNVLAHASPLENSVLRYAIAGLIAMMPESIALLAPNANSYRRFGSDSYAPLNTAWGYNNRTLALRIPSSSAQNRRIEYRIAGADANPYLVLAALLAGMHHGISNKLEPPPATTGNAYQQNLSTLAATWHEALAAFATGELLKNYIGDDFWRLYQTVKTAECREFAKTVTPLEQRWYLTAV